MGLRRLAATSALMFIAISSTSLALYNQQTTQLSNRSTETQRVIVKLRRPPGLAKLDGPLQNASGLIELQSLATQYGATTVEPMSLGRGNTSTEQKLIGLQIVEFGNSDAALAFVESCASAASIEYAEPDYLLEFFDLPNDSLFGYQWNLRNVGQSYISVFRVEGYNNDIQTMISGKSGADIKATEVAGSTSSDSVVVAIIDSGFDRFHPDLEGAVWRNGDEIPDNAQDDDHNGYVDDTWGWDFSANPNSVPIYSDNDPSDIFGHGTHCAGIVAAVGNNQLGVAGVSTHAKLMALKIWPTMSVSLAARAVIYATDNGADVISMSWGTAYESLLLHDALQYARSRGVVLCAASGNSGTQAAFFPAAYDFVIAVGASSSLDYVTEFSTYGNHIDICAPGESILSLRANGSDMYGESPSNEPIVHIVSDNYYEASGTSMACPHVAGAAAELRAHSQGLVPAKVEEILYGSCDDIVDPYNNGANLPGRDRFSGFGRLNLKRALEGTPEITAKIESPPEGAILSGQITVKGSALAPPNEIYAIAIRPSNDDTWTTIANGAAQIEQGVLTRWDTSRLEGSYELRLQVGDANMEIRSVLVVSEARAEFRNPVQSDLVMGATGLEIVAVCPRFEHSIVDYRAAGGSGEWNVIAELTEPAIGDETIFWDSSLLPDGEYSIRLRVFSQDGLADSEIITISVRSPFAAGRGWRTSIGFTPSIVPNYGDFDGDGQNEIVVGTEIGVLFFNPDGTRKTTGVPTLPFGNFLMPPVVCSLDGDSIDDLVVIRENFNSIFAFASNGERLDTSFYNEPKTWRYTTLKESHFPLLFAIDLNNDGRDEIVHKSGHGNSEDDDLIILSPGREENSCFPLDLDCSVVQAADLDGDRIYDIYTASANGRIRRFNLCGEVTDELVVGAENLQFVPTGMTAGDLSGDGIQDLVIMGYLKANSLDFGYILFAVDSHLRILSGSVRATGIPSILDPSMAVFGDIDGNREPETIVTFHDANYGYVFAWHSDGTPVIADQPMAGLLAVTAHPGICAMPVLVNTDLRDGAEVVCPTGRDLFGAFPRQRVEVFDYTGASVAGWPLYVAPHGQEALSKANIPMYGDIDRDGDMDMVMITPANELVFTSLEGIPWEGQEAFCPMWRYNRKMNNVAPDWNDVATSVNENQEWLPGVLMTVQNYPNPFNLSTIIEYTLPKHGEVKIEIYNILGQTIESLAMPAQSAGKHSIAWDATDDNGSALPSGIYFYRVMSNFTEATGKMMLLK